MIPNTLILPASVLSLLLSSASGILAQTPADVERERADYLHWLTTSHVSPLKALVQQPLGGGLSLGPAGSDIPLPGLEPHRLYPEGPRVILEAPTGRRLLARHRPISVGAYTLYLADAQDGTGLTVFGSNSGKSPPGYYPYDPSLVFTGPLVPARKPEKIRILSSDGATTEATEAGSVVVPLAGGTHLRVLRIEEGSEESALEIFFQDETNGRGSYPAGRFVSLIPIAGGYRLDFNRARNPFCAYSSAYPCPLPWRGNQLRAPVMAGERYQGGGLESSSSRVRGALAGPWRAVLDLAGGALPFRIQLDSIRSGWRGMLCNGTKCEPFSSVRASKDSVALEIADYDATISASIHPDSLLGHYHNVGSKGPRTIPFRAARGRWPVTTASKALVGRWDATYFQDGETSPRVLELHNEPTGFTGRIISSTADYGPFSGTVAADSFTIGLFDGSFVYLLTGKLQGDTLRGMFHAGLRTQTPWVAVRSTGAPHLESPTAISGADTTEPLRFAFPDLQGRMVRSDEPRFQGKVVLVEIFGSWCPTCHDATPELMRLYRRYHTRGLEVVGLAFEATGDTAIDARQVRRYRDKFGIGFPLLLAGVNDTESMAAALPQLYNLTAFPTTVFVGRNGRVRRIHAGFHGLVTGPQHRRMVREFEREIERLLKETVNGKR